MTNRPDGPPDPDLPPLRDPPRSFRQRWLSRLAFSFILTGAVLAWEASRVDRTGGDLSPRTRFVIYSFGAAVSFAMGVMGIRERHRRR
jgi:hypothetical protein